MGRREWLAAGLVGWILGCSGLLPQDIEVNDNDRAVFLEGGELVARQGLSLSGETREDWAKVRNFDGSWEVEYSFESDELSVEQAFFIERTASDAGTSYFGAKLGLTIAGGAEDEVQMVEAPDAWTWGDERECRRMVVEGMPFGVVCVAQMDTRVLLVSVAGIGPDFTRAGVMDELLAAEQPGFDAYEPTGLPLVD